MEDRIFAWTGSVPIRNRIQAQTAKHQLANGVLLRTHVSKVEIFGNRRYLPPFRPHITAQEEFES
jgi:hypothetical protein